MTEIATRFAPSPTGRLHLGHGWSALQAHDFATERRGHFLLRIEDIDPGRAREEHVSGIIEDLLWLGLTWEGEIVFQSQRLALYAMALEDLKERGLVYPCFCTRAEIAREIAASASAPHGPDGPHYPGTCRGIPAEAAAERAVHEAHCWRLDTARACAEAGPLSWTDGAGMNHRAHPQMHGDVVLGRKDAPVSYHLAVTIDDADQAISHVVRGADLLHATHVHRLLQALFDLPTPVYLHHALLATASGERLAKRNAAPAIADLRAAGVDPVALIEGMRAGQFPDGYRPLDLPVDALGP
ncbi:tRNA glutamyl-Q(34) synthetase GluQRS [Sphingomonas cavernae]|uniref:tRNA glutamyl-Q(34) synthetase GluQRS n=1 Tax=Sphingomonas cavernae TaxID=2320861 RepID=A0A418WRI3_9SPHN|nr:tRNA glutamyl-Q(34) synthetase GluQRS [Sphingomonas cavernae]RJF93864.1 tRNA glutamyl-Q(34) synthetase GluQRS [Sphingomonas cavernae]